MSMGVPRTGFSLLYNATSVGAFRREAHEDLRTSFRRFNVTDGAIQEVCTRIEDASYELRVSAVDPVASIPDEASQRRYDAARVELDEATDLFLRLLQPEIAGLLSNYHALGTTRGEYRTAGDVTVERWMASGHGLLLDLVYHCLYVPEFVTRVIADERTLMTARVPGDVIASLRFVARAFASPQEPAECARHARVLCEAIAAEYKNVGWLRCW